MAGSSFPLVHVHELNNFFFLESIKKKIQTQNTAPSSSQMLARLDLLVLHVNVTA